MKQLTLFSSPARLAAVLGTIGILVLTVPSAPAAGVSEPPVVVYGKVMHVDQGATYQVLDGALTLTLTNADDPANSVTRTVSLGPTGTGGAFSYRIEFPQESLPSADSLGTTLVVGTDPTPYELDGVTVDGVAAEPLDPAQGLIETAFANRGQEHRLDVRVSLPQLDSDGDGIPDWYEELNGLNPLYAGDATSDVDGDGWDALTEFQRNTDPAVSNTNPEIGTTSILVPAGGVGGLYLAVHDSDTDPSDLDLAITSAVIGLGFATSSGALSPGTPFTYADVLAGEISLTVAHDFAQGSLPMTINDSTGAATNVSFSVLVKAFSPELQAGRRPALWLDAQSLADLYGSDTDLDEWPDGSTQQRDGYQPTAAARPTFDVSEGVPVLDGDDFLYLDERNLALGAYTAFLCYQAASFGTNDQTLLSTGDLRVEIGGNTNAVSAQSLVARENGREIRGPLVETNLLTQITLAGGENNSFLAVGGEKLAVSHPGEPVLPAVFSTLGGRRSLTDTQAGNFLNGSVCEVLVYDQALEPGLRSRNEDYQLSRWGSLVVWDYRNETTSVQLAGRSGTRNSLNGGWGDDALAGGALGDVIRGGPGRDLLTGGPGGDRFQFFAHPGDDDEVSDFNDAEDVLDLTAIFADRDLSPAAYLNLVPEVTRGTNNTPVLVAVLEVNYDGVGEDVDQRIRLTGKTYSNADLPRLVGEGIIQLGGPQYPTAIALAASEQSLVETEVARTLTLTRTGNLAAALDVQLTFVGSAEADVDYQLGGLGGTGLVRTVSFAAGESSQAIDLTPIQDLLDESETITVGILAVPQLTDLPSSPLALTLDDAPEVAIQALMGVAQRLGPTAGLLQLTREGPLTDPLDVTLTFGGDALNGREYATLSPTFTFPAGEATGQLMIEPLALSPLQDRPVTAQVGIAPDTTRFAVAAPGSADVQILDAYAGTLQSFGAWRAFHYPADPRTDAVLLAADDDGDFLSNGLEYVYGTDPNDIADNASIAIFNSAGFVEVHATTAAGLTDMQLNLEFSTDFLNWSAQDDTFDVELEWLTDGRLRRIHRSRLSTANVLQSGVYRLLVTPLP